MIPFAVTTCRTHVVLRVEILHFQDPCLQAYSRRAPQFGSTYQRVEGYKVTSGTGPPSKGFPVCQHIGS